MDQRNPYTARGSRQPRPKLDFDVDLLVRWLMVAGATFFLICLRLLLGSEFVAGQTSSFSFDIGRQSREEIFFFGAILEGLGILIAIGKYATIGLGVWIVARLVLQRPISALWTQ